MTTPDDRRDVGLDDDRMLGNDDRGGTSETADSTDTAGTASTAGPAGSAGTSGATDITSSAMDEPLVADDQAVDYRARWEVVQQGFVDDPRNAVSEADKLVDDVLKHLANGFDRQRHSLESQWAGGEPSTEDLRSALQRYRAFFQRLLTL